MVKFVASHYRYQSFAWDRIDKLIQAAIKGGDVECVVWVLSLNNVPNNERYRALATNLLAKNVSQLDEGLFGEFVRGDHATYEWLMSQSYVILKQCLWIAARFNHAKLVDAFLARGVNFVSVYKSDFVSGSNQRLGESCHAWCSFWWSFGHC